MSDLVVQRDMVLGQRLEALVITDLLLDFRGLIGGDALGELFTTEEALPNPLLHRMEEREKTSLPGGFETVSE